MKRPQYLAIAAVTLDGKIAAHDHHMSSWTSKEDKKFMRSLLDTCDVIIVGNSTYKTALRPLSKRNCIVLTRTVKTLKRVSGTLVYINGENTDLKKFIQSEGYTKVAVLGGSQIYTYCLEHGMITDLYLTIEPLIFGSGIPLFNSFFKSQKTKVVSVRRLNKKGTVLIHAQLY